MSAKGYHETDLLKQQMMLFLYITADCLFPPAMHFSSSYLQSEAGQA